MRKTVAISIGIAMLLVGCARVASEAPGAMDSVSWRKNHYVKAGTLREKTMEDGSTIEFYECACGLVQLTLYDPQGNYGGGGSALSTDGLLEGSRKLPEP